MNSHVPQSPQQQGFQTGAKMTIDGNSDTYRNPLDLPGEGETVMSSAPSTRIIRTWPII